MLNELGKECNQIALDHGFDNKTYSIERTLMLIVSELSEAMEADRKNDYFESANSNMSKKYLDQLNNQLIRQGMLIDDSKLASVIKAYQTEFEESVKDTYEDELADAIIRILDHCHAQDIDIDFHVRAKMKYNSLREHKHGGKKY